MLGTTRSPETRAKIGRFGPEHHGWKGENVSYSGLHAWARRTFTKTGRCEVCGEERLTEWSNISGEYRREREDWREICRSCHRRLDGAVRNITQHA